MTKPVVVHLITSLDRGGAEAMLGRLVTAVSGGTGGGRHLVVSLAAKGPMADPMIVAGVPVYSLGFKPGRPSIAGFFHLWGLLRRERPDILQTWLYHADLLGLCVGKLARVPRIVWNVRCSNMDMRQYSKLTAMVLWLLARFSVIPNAVVVNSEAGRRAHVELGYRPRRWQLIPNGIDTDRFRPNPDLRALGRAELGLVDGDVAFVMAARFDPMKNFSGFLGAAAEIKATLPAAKFVLMGRGVIPDNSELAKLVAASGLGPSLSLLGERADLDQLMPAFDVAVVPSLFGEGFSNVLGEAMAAGVPCIATDVGDARDIIGETGLIVPAGDTARLAGAMRDLATMDRAALGVAARERISSRFSLPLIVAAYQSFYRELV
jgi:glycosyltransferase involved in cell wall biosynthesis